jgi:hypothetical protein
MNRDSLIGAWLKALHARCAPSANAEAHAAYALNLADTLERVPLEAFTQRSYMWVAQECPKGAPNAATLRQLLSQWMWEQKHAGADIDSEAQHYIDLFRRRWREGADKGTLLAIARQHYPKGARDVILREYVLGSGDKDRDEELADGDWWHERIRAIEMHPNATYRWREAQAMRELLLRPHAAPRPAAIEWLRQISNAAELEGADINIAHVRFAPDQEKAPV